MEIFIKLFLKEKIVIWKIRLGILGIIFACICLETKFLGIKLSIINPCPRYKELYSVLILINLIIEQIV